MHKHKLIELQKIIEEKIGSLLEEVEIGTPFEDRNVELLYDDTTEVGRVHLGVVHLFRLEQAKVQKREPMITNLDFLTQGELQERRENLETWSQICVDHLDRLLA